MLKVPVTKRDVTQIRVFHLRELRCGEGNNCCKRTTWRFLFAADALLQGSVVCEAWVSK